MIWKLGWRRSHFMRRNVPYSKQSQPASFLLKAESTVLKNSYFSRCQMKHGRFWTDFFITQSAPIQVMFGSAVPSRNPADRTSNNVLTGFTETSLLNTHFQWFILTVCEVLVIENKGAIYVRHRRLLSADRLCCFEQVYALPFPIWPWCISQPAICPVLYLLQWTSHVSVCVRPCVSSC